MSSSTILPENDRDLLLAQKLGDSIDAGTDFSAIGDDLIDLLAAYKDQETAQIHSIQPNSDSIWAAISKQTQSKAQASIHVLTKPAAYIQWAAAAVLVIAAFIGLFYYTSGNQPTIVAHSGSEKISVILEDGTKVTLRPNSSLIKLTSAENDRSYSLEGEAFFDVVSDSDHPFSVDAGAGTITVLGTRFNASNWGSATQVYLEEGRVRFTGPDSQSVELSPGEASSIQDGKLAPPEKVTEERFTDWLNNVIIFDNDSPASVVAEIGQHFNIHINIQNLEDRSPLNGSLQLSSPEQTLEDLGVVLGGTFRMESENSYTFISME